jgi:hypothetical protein
MQAMVWFGDAELKVVTTHTQIVDRPGPRRSRQMERAGGSPYKNSARYFGYFA